MLYANTVHVLLTRLYTSIDENEHPLLDSNKTLSPMAHSMHMHNLYSNDDQTS